MQRDKSRISVATVVRLILGVATELGSTGGGLFPTGPEAQEAST